MINIESKSDSEIVTKAESLGLTLENGRLENRSILNRVFLYCKGENLVLSRNAHELVEHFRPELSQDSINFYKKYGFVYPPYTIYKDIYLLSPFCAFDILSKSFQTSRLPAWKASEILTFSDLKKSIMDDLAQSISSEKCDYNVLFSAGIDSSVMLHIANKVSTVNTAINCYMSSMADESRKACEMAKSIDAKCRVVEISDNLTQEGAEFIHRFKEPISDRISIVIPNLLSSVELADDARVLDGQGADSLFCGLPHDKLLKLYQNRKIRPLMSLIPTVPVWRNKSSKVGRILYRISKVVNCLSSISPEKMLENSLIEEYTQELDDLNVVQDRMRSDISVISSSVDDFHIVIRYIFLFRVLHAREMQKYLLSANRGVEFKLPFLEDNFIEKYFFTPPRLCINEGIYKYPLTALAKDFWPKWFNSSRTSPFQVEYNMGGKDVKEFSLSKLDS